MVTAEIAAFSAAGVALIVGLVNPIYQAKRADGRQREQLLYDRQERSRQEIVDLVESAAVALGVGRRRQEKIHHLWKTGVPVASPLADQELLARTESVEGIRNSHSRLLLRYPEDHSLPTAYREAIKAVDAYRMSLAGYMNSEDYRSNMPAINQARAALVHAESAFLDTSRVELAQHGGEMQTGDG